MKPRFPRRGPTLKADLARYEELHQQLVAVVRQAHEAGIEMAGFVASALGEVAAALPGRTEEFLEQRPGSWEAAALRTLIAGTIGYEQLDEAPEWFSSQRPAQDKDKAP